LYTKTLETFENKNLKNLKSKKPFEDFEKLGFCSPAKTCNLIWREELLAKSRRRISHESRVLALANSEYGWKPPEPRLLIF